MLSVILLCVILLSASELNITRLNGAITWSVIILSVAIPNVTAEPNILSVVIPIVVAPPKLS
jgi:hypothetical protein